MKTRRIIASFLSLCMLGGTLSYNFSSTTISAAAVESKIEGKKETTTIADAAGSCYTFDAETGTLTLKGNIVLEEITGFENKEAVKTITAEKGTVFPESCHSLFSGYSECESIDLSNVDTSNVTDMNCMFSRCKELTSIDLSNFDTSKVTYMRSVFYSCSRLTSLDLSNFDTSKVTDMSSIFEECSSLKKLSLGKDFKNITEEACLQNGNGWVNSNNASTIISGDGKYAVINNTGQNTYYRLENSSTPSTTTTTTTTTTTKTTTTTQTTTKPVNVPTKPFVWGRDNWNFYNSSYYGDFNSVSCKEQILSSYLDILKNNLTNSEYDAIFNGYIDSLGYYHQAWIDEKWHGSCYEMSATTLLSQAGLLPYSKYKSGADCLYKLNKPSQNMNVSSLITYYQMLQVKDVIQQQYRDVPIPLMIPMLLSVISGTKRTSV